MDDALLFVAILWGGFLVGAAGCLAWDYAARRIEAKRKAQQIDAEWMTVSKEWSA